MLTYLLLAAALVADPTSARQPTIPNRAAKSDEIGYRPAVGAVAVFNPPSLTWLHETAAHTYEVQWSTSRNFSEPQAASSLPFNTYTHSETLPLGNWFWRYCYTTIGGKTSTWSQTRSFQIDGSSIEFPMPTRAQQRERVPQGHPRLFVRPEDLAGLRAIAVLSSTPANPVARGRFREILAEANRLLRTPPTKEPTVLGSNRNPETRGFWWPNRTQTEKACMEAETLAFVHLITGDAKYGQAARQRIVALAAWDPDGPTNFKLNCEAAKPILFRLPRAYDWAYDTLTESERDQVRQVMRRRALDAWNSGEVGKGVGHLNRPYSSHGNRTFHKLGECAIAFLGEIPEAETWLDYAINKFYAAYPVWADVDGGWHEGGSYWSGYLSKVVWWLDVSRSALQIDGLKKPFFAHVGDYPLYLAPPGSPNLGFGDLSFRPPSSSYGRFTEYFQRTSAPNAAYWRWWSEQWGTDEAQGIMGFLWAARLPEPPAPKAPTDIPQSKAFYGIGVASLHCTLTNSAEDVHFLFKSSPFGSQSHGHNPQNSFQLNAYGETLLTTCVYRDWHGSPFHYKWAHSTRAHNAVLIDGQGQIPHTAEYQGRILDFHTSPGFDYVVGSAASAYGGRLDRFRRAVAFVKPDLLVICDDLAATNEVTFQFLSHALKPFDLAPAKRSLSVEMPRAGVEITYFSPVPLNFTETDGYNPKPEKDFPNQWHVEASTTEPRREIRMLTVLAPHKKGAKPGWAFSQTESPNAIGLRCERAGERFFVAFRKSEKPGTATLADFTFDAPVALLRRSE